VNFQRDEIEGNLLNMDDDNEQLYWLQLLSDLGTSRPVEIDSGYHNQKESVPLETTSEYFYLDKINQDVNIQPGTHNNSNLDNIWLLGKEITTSNVNHSEEEQQHHISEGLHSKRTSEGTRITDSPPPPDYPPPTPPFSAGPSQLNNQPVSVVGRNIVKTEELPLEATSHSSNSSDDHSIDHMWANEYPKALELIRSELIFHRFVVDEEGKNIDLESINENDDDTGFEVISHSSQKERDTNGNDDVFVVQVPSSSKSIKYGYPSAVRLLTAFRFQNLVKYTPSLDDISYYTSKSLNAFANLALKHLYHVKSNVIISSFLGTLNESSIFIHDKVQNTINDLSSVSSTSSASASFNFTSSEAIPSTTEEIRHLEKLQAEIGWENISLRYCMSSIPWKERQLLKETRENNNRANVISNMSQFRERIKTLLKQQQEGNEASNPQRRRSSLDGREEESETEQSDDIQQEPSFYDVLCHDAYFSDKSNTNSSSSNEDPSHIQAVLQKYFTAPLPIEQSSCQICLRSFNLTCFRYHCRYCGNSICDNHSKNRRKIYRFGLVKYPVRVCDRCCYVIDEIHRRDSLIWKDNRILSYLKGELIRYPSIPWNYNEGR
jgi:hypothetical protein